MSLKNTGGLKWGIFSMPEDLSKALSFPSVQDVKPGKGGGMEDVTAAKHSDSPWPL